MDSYQFSFEKLEVWQLSRILSCDIYLLSKAFPAEERFSLTTQARRAALSVGANIAEGSSRINPKDQARFTIMAYSSLMELFNHIIIASDLGYITSQELGEFRRKIQILSVKLNNLKIAQLKRENKSGE